MQKRTLYKDGNFYKGNLHSHTTVSDGKHSPEEVKRMYMEKGYSFFAYTDHNIYGIFDELCDDKFVTLPGTEINHDYDDFRVDHLVCIGIEGKNIFAHGTKFPQDMWKPYNAQTITDYFNQNGNIVFFAHPNGCKIGHSELTDVNGLYGLEIFNSGCETILKCGLSEDFYDKMLFLNYRTPDGHLPYCVASDDAHLEAADFFKGWIVVKAEELSRKAITQAILDGSFYASRGPEIYDFYIEDEKAVFNCSPCRSVYIFSDNRNFKYVHKRETGCDITHVEFNITGMELPYLRAVCVANDGCEAWTQPISPVR